MSNIEDDFDIDSIHVNMRYNQVVNVCKAFDKVKKENTELKDTVKTLKNMMLYYKNIRCNL